VPCSSIGQSGISSWGRGAPGDYGAATIRPIAHCHIDYSTDSGFRATITSQVPELLHLLGVTKSDRSWHALPLGMAEDASHLEGAAGQLQVPEWLISLAHYTGGQSGLLFQRWWLTTLMLRSGGGLEGALPAPNLLRQNHCGRLLDYRVFLRMNLHQNQRRHSRFSRLRFTTGSSPSSMTQRVASAITVPDSAPLRTSPG
jgi:hypothetical protein